MNTFKIGDEITPIINFIKMGNFEGNRSLVIGRKYKVYNIKNTLITFEFGNELIGPFSINDIVDKVERCTS